MLVCSILLYDWPAPVLPVGRAEQSDFRHFADISKKENSCLRQGTVKTAVPSFGNGTKKFTDQFSLGGK